MTYFLLTKKQLQGYTTIGQKSLNGLCERTLARKRICTAGTTTYYLLPTTYSNRYFLSFFSFYAEKTLTNINIHATCFANYMGPASAENTNNFSYNTNNFSFSPNNFSDSPSNFPDFPAIFGIKKWRYPDFSGYLHVCTTKIINFGAKCKSVNFR